MNLFKLLRFILMHPLNREGRLAAISRFVRWQIACRLLDSKIEFPFVENTKLFAKRGMTGATGNWYCGLHEAHDMGFVLHTLRPGSLFLDIGANIGSYTVLAAGGVGASVICVEPISSTFEHLNANILLNGLGDRVQLHCVGVSDKSGILRFSSEQDTVNHVLGAYEIAPHVEVPVTTIDTLCADRIPNVIKIDVEGHEKAVLLGASITLASTDLLAVVMETNGSGLRYGENDTDLFSIMSKFGFSPVGYDIFSRRLLDRPIAGGNTIFVKNLARVQSLVTSARRYRLVNGWV